MKSLSCVIDNSSVSTRYCLGNQCQKYQSGHIPMTRKRIHYDIYYSYTSIAITHVILESERPELSLKRDEYDLDG